jgi:hypothetical protein
MIAHFSTFITLNAEIMPSPGVVALAQGIALGVAIEALHEFWACSAHSEWRNQFVFLPFASAR